MKKHIAFISILLTVFFINCLEAKGSGYRREKYYSMYDKSKDNISEKRRKNYQKYLNDDDTDVYIKEEPASNETAKKDTAPQKVS